MSRRSRPVPVTGAWFLVPTPHLLWAQPGPGLLGQAALFPGPRAPQSTFSLVLCHPWGTSWSGPLSRVGACPWRLCTGLWSIGQTQQWRADTPVRTACLALPRGWPLEHRPDPAVASRHPCEDRLSGPIPWLAPGFPAPPPRLEPSRQGRGSLLPAVGVQAPDPGPLPRVLRPLLISLPPPSCLLDGNKSMEGLPASCGLPGAAMATAFGNPSFRNSSGNSVPRGWHSSADLQAQYSSARSPVCLWDSGC